jgi:hypothetical protein
MIARGFCEEGETSLFVANPKIWNETSVQLRALRTHGLPHPPGTGRHVAQGVVPSLVCDRVHQRRIAGTQRDHEIELLDTCLPWTVDLELRMEETVYIELP